MATQRKMEQYDVRIVQRGILRGSMSRAEYDKYLKDLPDVADKAIEFEEEQPLKPRESGFGG